MSDDANRLLRLVTWNVQGSQGVDQAEVPARIRALAGGVPDVVVFQEIQSGQAKGLAATLGMGHHWSFKHWPVVRGCEGLAVLVRGEVVRSNPVLLQRAPFWSWRRRTMLLVELATDAGPVVVADVHLSPHDLAERRSAEASLVLTEVLRFAAERGALIVGDFNDHPGAATHEHLKAAGWRDAWAEVHGDQPEPAGASNWTEGARAGRPPTQRLDFVLVPPGWEIVEASVAPAGPDGGYDDWALLSDHLPVAVTLRRTAT